MTCTSYIRVKGPVKAPAVYDWFGPDWCGPEAADPQPLLLFLVAGEQEACSWEENVEWTASWGEGMWLLHDERDDESERFAGSWPEEAFEENGGYHIDMAEQEKEEA